MGCGLGANRLLAETQPADQFGVTARVLGLEVVKETPPLPDELQQPTSRVMVFRMDLKMLGQIADPFTQDRDLHFGRTGVCPVHLI